MRSKPYGASSVESISINLLSDLHNVSTLCSTQIGAENSDVLLSESVAVDTQSLEIEYFSEREPQNFRRTKNNVIITGGLQSVSIFTGLSWKTIKNIHKREGKGNQSLLSNWNLIGGDRIYYHLVLTQPAKAPFVGMR